MVRLMLVLAPVMCILGGIAVSSLLQRFMKDIDTGGKTQDKRLGKKDAQHGQQKRSEVSTIV